MTTPAQSSPSASARVLAESANIDIRTTRKALRTDAQLRPGVVQRIAKAAAAQRANLAALEAAQRLVGALGGVLPHCPTPEARQALAVAFEATQDVLRAAVGLPTE